MFSLLTLSLSLGVCRPQDGEVLGEAGRDPGHTAGAEDLVLEAADDGPGETGDQVGGEVSAVSAAPTLPTLPTVSS